MKKQLILDENDITQALVNSISGITPENIELTRYTETIGYGVTEENVEHVGAIVTLPNDYPMNGRRKTDGH